MQDLFIGYPPVSWEIPSCSIVDHDKNQSPTNNIGPIETTTVVFS